MRASSPPARCAWGADPLAVRYHDEEWGVPVRDDPRLFEFLVLEGAQAGLSWMTILRKRERYRAVFAGFDPQRVARYTPRKIESLLRDPGIVRNRLKIQAAVSKCPCVPHRPGASRKLRPIPMALRRRPSDPEPLATDRGCAGELVGIRRVQQRPEASRVPLCRNDHCLRAYAGRRNGQRPHRRLLSPQCTAAAG